jgi:hypothetical protein
VIEEVLMNAIRISGPRIAVLFGLIAVGLVCLSSGPAGARDKGRESDWAAAIEKVHHLLREAEEWMEEGRIDQARELMKQARALKEKLGRELNGKRGKVFDRDPLKKILTGLDHGVASLKALNMHDEAKRLAEISAGVKQRLTHAERKKEKGHSEREVAIHQLEVLGLAKHAFREAEKGDCLERIEHAMHARELALKGRRDAEARKIQKSAPGREEVAKLLFLAGRIWREYKNADKAEYCEALAKKYAGHLENRRKGRDKERAAAEKHIEIMHVAMKALLEAERKDAAHLLEKKIHAMKVSLEGRRDREAVEIRESAPSHSQVARMLLAAAKLWKEFKNPDRADGCAELSHHYLALAKKAQPHRKRETKRRERPQSRERERGGVEDRLHRLEGQVGELRHLVEKLLERLEHRERDRRR